MQELKGKLLNTLMASMNSSSTIKAGWHNILHLKSFQKNSKGLPTTKNMVLFSPCMQAHALIPYNGLHQRPVAAIIAIQKSYRCSRCITFWTTCHWCYKRRWWTRVRFLLRFQWYAVVRIQCHQLEKASIASAVRRQWQRCHHHIVVLGSPRSVVGSVRERFVGRCMSIYHLWGRCCSYTNHYAHTNFAIQCAQHQDAKETQ